MRWRWLLRNLYRSLWKRLRISLLLLLLHLLLTLLQFLQKLLWSFYVAIPERILRRGLLLIIAGLRLVSLIIRWLVGFRHRRISSVIRRCFRGFTGLRHTHGGLVLSCSWT